MAAIIGIDLGTTFSAVAQLDDIGRPVILRDELGANIMPSCVSDKDGKLLVGENARIKALLDLDSKRAKKQEERVGARFKRFMGSSATHSVSDREFTPTELSSFVLKKLVSLAENQIGSVSDAIVTIPANFAHEAREATIEAARAAGLNVKHIINEPTAAALFYANQVDDDMHGHYAVFDLGGGTFDISIIKIDGEKIRVVSSSGVSRLGGDDFDKALIALVARKFEAETGRKMDPEDFGLDEAEQLKKKLTTMESDEARIGRRVFITVTRDEFEEEISGFLAQLNMHCESALDEAELSSEEVKAVFLAGGSSRIPSVKSVVRTFFNMEPTETANLDEVVALGAALYAARKADPSILNAAQKTSVSKIGLEEIAAYCFGTLSLSYDDESGKGKMQNSVLIKKGTAIPCSVTQEFFTVREDQRAVDLAVTRSTHPETDPEFVKVVWNGTLSLPSGRPSGQQVDVTFSIDENGSMHCFFKDVESKKKIEVDINEGIKMRREESSVDQFTVE